MKRSTLAVFDHFTDAWPFLRKLQAAGVDVKVVSKHALQVHPDQVARAVEVLRELSTDDDAAPQRA